MWKLGIVNHVFGPDVARYLFQYVCVIRSLEVEVMDELVRVHCVLDVYNDSNVRNHCEVYIKLMRLVWLLNGYPTMRISARRRLPPHVYQLVKGQCLHRISSTIIMCADNVMDSGVMSYSDSSDCQWYVHSSSISRVVLTRGSHGCSHRAGRISNVSQRIINSRTVRRNDCVVRNVSRRIASSSSSNSSSMRRKCVSDSTIMDVDVSNYVKRMFSEVVRVDLTGEEDSSSESTSDDCLSD